jgi:hypothetical protein
MSLPGPNNPTPTYEPYNRLNGTFQSDVV